MTGEPEPKPTPPAIESLISAMGDVFKGFIHALRTQPISRLFDGTLDPIDSTHKKRST